ncbi:Excinuclease ABC subunit C [Beijerinckiaceae bacterium RH AL1]|nr:GIY-YIG nuclease family protein [Beijerinckiaceae bacterium]VVB46653.1 Excinuclease ABC subunit C [Beijerinckiaceae bacterium RH CH11]VVB46737.1 Excinuclease ABC subunit C [Beijerinckiaceae bacterium RH AL8]VVC55483.1 Excinuclease ABC subunit C [Beijerinckiaceae bacterium RH AL1]
MDGASLYILRCADGKLYIGLTRREVDARVSEHQNGLSAFTRSRRPVTLIFSEHYPSLTDAIAAERRMKGWTRAKKLAYVAAEWERLQHLARRRTSSRDKAAASEPPGSRRASRSSP